MTPDLINGSFELLAGVAVLNHCYALHQHQQVRGVAITSVIFFTAWGFWNPYYYLHLAQFWSFAGGVFVLLANLFYIAMLLRYRNHIPPIADKDRERIEQLEKIYLNQGVQDGISE